MATPTFGAQRVRFEFNPSSNTAADPRLKALAMAAAEEATMWGVKVVTAPTT